MRLTRKFGAALGALALLLGGCGAILGGGGSADLYRFGSAPAPEAAPPQATSPGLSQRALILYPGAIFERPIAGDRILTVTGSQAAYVARARWVAQAPDLFDASVRQAFHQRAPGAMVVRLRGVPVPDYALGIDVRRFEADYAAGPEAPPEIILEANARLMRWSDRVIVGEWPVVVREPAQVNSVTNIVAAFDRATATTVARIADYTQEALSREPPRQARGGI